MVQKLSSERQTANEEPVSSLSLLTNVNLELFVFQLVILIICNYFWMCGAFGDMLKRIVSNSHFGNGLGPEI